MQKLQQMFGLLLFMLLFVATSNVAATPVSRSHNVENDVLINGYEEMLPGVFVNYTWVNYDYTYNYTYDSSVIYDDGKNDTSIGTGNTGQQGTDPRDFYYYPVMTTNGSWYFITYNETGYWFSSMNYTSYTVNIFMDEDGSVMDNLAPGEDPQNVFHGNSMMAGHGHEKPTSIGPVVSEAKLSGDEMFFTTSVQLYSWSYDYSYNIDYFWYSYNHMTNELTPVDPASVIPNLASDYVWAEGMNSSYSSVDNGTYYGVAFSINILSLIDFTAFTSNTTDKFAVLETSHFFEGMSLYNDTNDNGVMDINTSRGYTIDEFNSTSTEINHENTTNDLSSELIANVWLEGYGYLNVLSPHVNNGKIDWSVELRDITGALISPYDGYGYIEGGKEGGGGIGGMLGGDFGGAGGAIGSSGGAGGAGGAQGYGYLNSAVFDIEYLKFAYHFVPADGTADLKVDQCVGEFSHDNTTILSSLTGLSLSLNYWSSFNTNRFRETINAEVYDTGALDGAAATFVDDDKEIEEVNVTSSSAGCEKGNIDFSLTRPKKDGSLDKSSPMLQFASVDFGGTYIWGKDNNTYKVYTSILPMWAFSNDMWNSPGMYDSMGQGSFSCAVFYYSSCYPLWDGYSITHDPIFSVVSAQKLDTSPPDESQTPAVPGFELVEIFVAIVGLTVYCHTRSRKIE